MATYICNDKYTLWIPSPPKWQAAECAEHWAGRTGDLWESADGVALGHGQDADYSTVLGIKSTTKPISSIDWVALLKDR